MVIVEVLAFVWGCGFTGTDYIIEMNLPPKLTKSGHPVTIMIMSWTKDCG